MPSVAMYAVRRRVRVGDLHGDKHWRKFLLPAEQNTLCYPIATSYLGEARIRPDRLFEDLTFVRFAETPTTTLARRWNDGT